MPKEKLTIQSAIDNKLTPIGCVKYYFPDISDEHVDYIIWEQTCFPMSTEVFLDQLYEIYLSKCK